MKKIAYLKKENKKTFSRRNLLSSATKKLVTTLMVLLFLAQMIAPFIISAENKTLNNNGPVKASPQGETKNVSNWKQLMDLGNENGGVVTIDKDYIIKITDNLVATCPIIITGNVHISADSDKTIYRDKNNTNFTVFTVDNGGTLTLGNHVIMTGEVASEYSKIYTLTVKDGAGNTIYKKHVLPTETKTINQLLVNAKPYFSLPNKEVIFEEDATGTQGIDWQFSGDVNLNNDTARTNLFDVLFENKPDSPYKKGFTFDEWNYGNDANGNAINGNTTMSTVDGDVTVVAKWKGHYLFKVTDGFGNIIYEETLNEGETRSCEQIMSQAGLIDASSRNSILLAALQNKNGPYQDRYQFDSWDYGEVVPSRPHNKLQPEPSSVTVIAKWKEPERDYKLTVTDGYGNVVYQNDNVDKTKTVDELMSSASLTTADGRTNAFNNTLKNNSASPYYENNGVIEYDFVSWNYGNDANGNAINGNTTMSTVGGDLTVGATWKKKLTFTVTDGYGNVIYERKNISINDNTTVQSLMQNATVGNLLNDESRNTALASTLAGKESPQNSNYTFTGWNYGKDSNNNDIGLNTTLSSLGGNLTVCATWQAPSGTEYTWTVPEVKEGTTMQIGIGDKFVDYSTSGSGYITHFTENLGEASTWVMTDVQPNKSFRLRNAENSNLYLIIRYFSSGQPNFNHEVLVGGSGFLNSSFYVDFFQFEIDGDNAYLIADSSKFHPDYEGTKKYLIKEASGIDKIWFNKNKPNDNVTPYVGQATEVTEFENSDTPGYSEVENFNGTLNPVGYSEASSKIQPSGGYNLNSPTDSPGKQEPYGFVEGDKPNSDVAGRYDVSDESASYNKINSTSIEPALYRKNGNITNLEPIRQNFVSENKGFFVKVNNGGTFDLEGATLHNFNTVSVADNTPVGVAPVYVEGNFNMTSGNIEDNWVGYIADDNFSGMNVTKRTGDRNTDSSTYNDVKSYLDNTTPTKTAGGIIFANGAKGVITGKSYIKGNRGDAGGIIVNGKDTDVTIGGHLVYTVNNSIPDNKEYFILGNDDKFYYKDETLPDGVNPKDNNKYEGSIDSEVGGGHIDNNVGFHYAGAALVENGATLRMVGANSTMNNNVTWNRGGAVYVTEFGTGGDGHGVKIDRNAKKVIENGNRQPYKEGTFIMTNGYIDNNTAFIRGGGINVESNRVFLVGGQISNNNCRALGGGIYVEGDYADYTYTLVINKGYVGHNYAVRYWDTDGTIAANMKKATDEIGAWDNLTIAQLNDRLDRKISSTSNNVNITNNTIGRSSSINANPESPLDDTKIANNSADYPNRTADVRDFRNPHEGNGGGVWLCPIGGTAVFHMSSDNEVIIDDNFASGKNNSDNTRGTDLYLHSGTGHMIVNNDATSTLEVWKNEKTGEQIEDSSSGKTYSGPLYLINETEPNQIYINADNESITYGQRKDRAEHEGIHIIDNISRDGGGIAANGTLLFGLPNDVYRHEAELDFLKEWPDANDTYPVSFKMFYLDANDNEVALPDYDFGLNGVNNEVTEYDYSPETGSSSSVWKARTTIPVSVTLSDGKTYPMYKLKYTGTPFTYQIKNSATESTISVDNDTIDPSTVEGMKKLYAISEHDKENKTSTQLEIVEWKLVIKEYDASGNYVSTAEFSKIISDAVTVSYDNSIPIDVIDAGGVGKRVKGYNINFSSVDFVSKVRNGYGPETEKYINNVVHDDLVSFDETFEYEIMAYVPIDANEFIIFDTLQESLMFVDRNGNEQFAQGNETSAQNSFLSGSLSGYEDAAKLISANNYAPNYLDDFTLEPLSNIEGISAGQNNAFIKTEDNYYVKALRSQGDSQSWNNGGVWRTKTTSSADDWIITYYNSNTQAQKATGNNPALEVYFDNNHIGNGSGTVSTDGNAFTKPLKTSGHVMIGDAPTQDQIDNNTVVMPSSNKKSGNTLYVKVDENSGIKDIRGKWIKISFNAAIKPSYRNLEKLQSSEGWLTNEDSKVGNPIPNYRGSISYVGSDWDLISGIENVCNRDEIEKAVYGEAKRHTFVRDTDGNIYDYDKESSNPQWKQVGKNDIEEKTGYNLYNLAISRLDNPPAGFRVLTLNKQYVYKNNDDFLIDGNTALNSMLGDAIIVDGAYGEAPSSDGRMFLKDSNGNYYWAPKTNVQKVNGKYQLADGKTVNDIVWAKLTENSSNPSINDAKIRIEDNKNVDSDVRDMVLTKHSYNWPVINAQEPHTGENNKANYLITRTSGKSLYKTNIVTIDVAEPEKYVNGKVHDILGAHDEGYFDQMFEYTILVKVPEDAEEVLIYDTLRPDLMFVDYLGNTQYKAFSIGTNNNNSTVKSDVYNTNFTPNDSFNGYANRMITNSAGVPVDGVEQAKDIYYLLVKDTNDHKGDGTGTASKKGRNDGVHLMEPVTGTNNSFIKIGDLVTNTDGSVSVNENNEGNTLLIKVSKETLDAYDDAKTPIRGKWIQATFRAQIKPGSYPYIVQKLEKKETTLTTDKTSAVDYDSNNDKATVTAYKIRSAEYYLANTDYNNTETHYYFEVGSLDVLTIDKTLSPDYNVITHEANNYGYLYDYGNENYNQFAARIGQIPAGRDYKEAYFDKTKIKSFANAAEFYTYTNNHENVQGPYLKKDFDTIVYQKPDGIAGTDYLELYENKSWNNSERWPTTYSGPYNWEEVTDDRHIVNPSDLNSEENHAGLANDAHYIPKFENEYHSMTTNTVTVEPKLRNLEITKKWIVGEDFVMPTMEEFKDYLHLWWEKTDENGQDSETDKLTGEITNVATINGETFYKDHIEITYEDVPASSQETAGVRHYWKITIKNLPILRPSMKYFVTEDKIPGMNTPMYNNVNDTTTEHAHHEGGITNIEEDLEDETHVEVSKVWDVGKSVEKESSANDITVQLMYVEEDGSKTPVYQRDDNGAIIYEQGNPLIVTRTLKGTDPSPWSYVFTKLPLYRLTDNGDRIQKEINGKKVFIDGSGDEFCVDMSSGKVYDKDGTTELDSDQQTSRGIDVNTRSTITVNNTMSYVVAKYTVDILDDPDGYILAYETETIINHHYTYTELKSKSKYLDENNNPISVGALLFNDKTQQYDIFKSDTSEYELYECEDPIPPSTGTGTRACKAYIQSDIEYPTYEIEIVNSKPEIEKYINKDVHLKTYFTNSFVYDILVYVPEEATEIEINDELMDTLVLQSFLEPEYGHENIVTGYKETSASQINNKTIEMAVHATNDHTINGTVASKNTAGTASGIISVNGNSFSIKINNIHYWGSDFIVDDDSGEYIKASDNQYYRVNRVKGTDLDYNYDPNDSSVLTISLLKDGLTRIDNHFYSHIKTHSSYVEDENGEYILGSDGNYYHKDISLPNGVDRVGISYYAMIVKQGEYVRDDNGTYVLASDNNYYPANNVPDGLTIPFENDRYSFVANSNLNLIGGRYVQVSFKATFNHEYDEQLKQWTNSILSPITPKPELDWDVIRTNDNQGWDTQIGKITNESYVDMDSGIIGSLLWQLGDKASTITKVVKTNTYYAAKGNDGKVYVSPVNPTKTQNINKWFYRVENNNEILNLDGTVANVWEGDEYTYKNIDTAISNGTDIMSKAIVVPIVEHERYLYIDEKYYLEDLALKYAPEASLTDTVKNTKYVKVDWGRGDGDVIRDSSSEYGTGNHAGIVNTASYEVTYGNRIKSTHKSNTVTVVPHVYELPSSGGIGTFLFNILGVMFMTLALTEFVLKKRKRKIY